MSVSQKIAITIRKDVIVGKAGQRDLRGDLYLPSHEVADRPAIVILHGGGWRKGSPNGVRGFGIRLSEAGFVCLCVDYRLTPEARWPAQIEDSKCAIRYLRAHRRDLRIDSERIGVLGDSAGGHLALMAGVVSDFEGTGGHTEFPSTPQAICAMYPHSQIGRTSDAADRLIGREASAAACDAASPISYDLGDFPPCLLIHGAEDAAVPFTESTDFHQKLLSNRRVTELHLFAGQGHAFDRQSSSQPGMVDIADPSAIYGPVILEIIRLFFNKYLSNPHASPAARNASK